jgi:hypothetical protein
MDESVFKTAISAISSGEYSESDVRHAKQWLDELNQKELSIKRKMEKTKNEFVKNKGRASTELKAVRADIRSVKNILKAV